MELQAQDLGVGTQMHIVASETISPKTYKTRLTKAKKKAKNKKTTAKRKKVK